MPLESLTIPLLREVIYDTYANFPSAGLSVGDLGWATDRLCLYRWSGSAWQSIGISSRHGNYADIGDPANYPESSLYQADDQGVLYMLVSGAWTAIVQPPILQTQNDVTGSRALTTNYQNTSGILKLVSVVIDAGAGKGRIMGYCDATSTPTLMVSAQYGDYYADHCYCSVHFLVPLNYYYRVEANAAIVNWIEYY